MGQIDAGSSHFQMMACREARNPAPDPGAGRTGATPSDWDAPSPMACLRKPKTCCPSVRWHISTKLKIPEQRSPGSPSGELTLVFMIFMMEVIQTILEVTPFPLEHFHLY